MSNHDHYSDEMMRSVLKSVKSIAIIGASGNTIRPSYFVAKYMAAKGYKLFPSTLVTQAKKLPMP